MPKKKVEAVEEQQDNPVSTCIHQNQSDDNGVLKCNDCGKQLN